MRSHLRFEIGKRPLFGTPKGPTHRACTTPALLGYRNTLSMDLEKRLEDLKSRKRELQDRLAQSKKEFLGLQKEKKRTLENQIRRAQYRITAAERKRRTRQLILIGSAVKKKADQDSRTRLWLLQALDEALERTQDRELFDLDPKKENRNGTPDTTASTGAATADPLPGWRPHHLKTGDWGSIYLGDTSILPPELVGARIIVQSKDGQSWTTTVTAVLDRSSEQVIVTNSGRPAVP